MIYNPFLFEINVRFLLNRFGSEKGKARLTEIPDDYWKMLREKGIDYIWLMGVWKTCDTVIDRCCFEPWLVQSYDRALKDWKREDVIGSPYAICNYVIDPNIGTQDELAELHDKLHSFDLKLILDFVPNHFNADTVLLEKHPDIFLTGNEQDLKDDNYTFFTSPKSPGRIFAHGRDPFFPAWSDTVQLNWFSSETRKYMEEKLLDITKVCDGVRCDMTMLTLNNVFQNTWGGIVDSEKYPKPEVEFWEPVIKKVKRKRDDFIFIAEAYWDLEYKMQQLGFDYTYDKKLYDRLKDAGPRSIRDHLSADSSYRTKCVRFIENHDELRAIEAFSQDKSFAAAVIISTIEGMKLFYDGQFEGKRIKMPVQLGREPKESPNEVTLRFYNNLLNITKEEIFHYGSWKLLLPEPSGTGNTSSCYILAWKWTYEDETRIVVVNYSDHASQCRLKWKVPRGKEKFLLVDLLNNKEYTRTSKEITEDGLYIDLASYHSHIFQVTPIDS
jgi:glycosidase